MPSSNTLILASASPRRRELLRGAGVIFEVATSNCEEIPAAGEKPEAMVRRLALAKASAVAAKNPEVWVLGADTDVSIDGEILGKPVDAADAARLLRMIQGRTHEVWGAFALLHRGKSIEHVEVSRTAVEIAPLTRGQIDWYVGTGEPLDKAGAYGAQAIGAQFIQSINGSYTNVVGLDLHAVMRALRKFGVVNDGAK